MEKKSKADLGTKKPPEKPPEKPTKRGQYHERECPYCHTPVRNLPNHIRLKHPQESKKPPEPPISKESLLTGVKPKKEADPASNTLKTPYYCTNCKAELRKDENPCWQCGEYLNWEGIE